MATVLVVDDSAVERHRVEKLLGKIADVTVVTAANGRDAIELLKKGSIDLVLTDMQMPEMDELK